MEATKRGNSRPNTNIPTILKIVLTNNEELGKTGMPTLVWQ